MTNCKKYENHFVLSIYKELSEKEQAALDKHLQKCTKCQQEFKQIKATLGVMDQRQHPEPEAEFWDGFWGGVQVKMHQPLPQKAPVWARLKEWPIIHRLPRFSLQISTAMAMLLIGIFIGKFYFSYNAQNKNQVLTTESEGMPIELQKQTSTYLEKTNLLLLGIANFDTKNEDPFILDLKNNKKFSQDLIKQAAVLKHDLSEANAPRLLSLLSELEVILMQLANLEEENDLPGIEFVQSAIEGRSILLKINLEQIRSNKMHSPVPKKQNEKSKSQL